MKNPLRILDGRGKMPVANMRHYFEMIVHDTPKLAGQVSLEFVKNAEVFSHYKEDETDALWLHSVMDAVSSVLKTRPPKPPPPERGIILFGNEILCPDPFCRGPVTAVPPGQLYRCKQCQGVWKITPITQPEAIILAD